MRLETHSHLKRAQIFEAAKKYFGEGGLAMKVGAEEGTQIQFFGGGIVWITVWPEVEGEKESRVDLDVSDRDAEARDFIEKVLRAPEVATTGTTTTGAE